MAIAAEAAARLGKVLTRNAATESQYRRNGPGQSRRSSERRRRTRRQ
jgi:hypothetical protein